MTPISSGLTHLAQIPPAWLRGQRLGLLCNPASVDHHLRHARHVVEDVYPGQLKALFTPQHGFFAEKQDNMIESGHGFDPRLNIPIYSLYGDTRQPSDEMIDRIDVLLVDLQDVGTRVYTFVWTLSLCMEAMGRQQKPVVILDRPNPIGGTRIEGNCLDPACRSFVGRFAIPMRHGLTMGELGLLLNDHFGIGARVKVIPLKGWRREMYFEETGLPWVAPSPNLPTPTSALTYPGQVLWEGTNVSEGRGTTQPFELMGAPFIDPRQVMDHLDSTALTGLVLRPCGFEPTGNKWQGHLCHGFQLHVTDVRSFNPYLSALYLVQTLATLYPTRFQWKQPPYEYEFERLPMDLILGSRYLRRALESGLPVADQVAAWQADLEDFDQLRNTYLLYR